VEEKTLVTAICPYYGFYVPVYAIDETVNYIKRADPVPEAPS